MLLRAYGLPMASTEMARFDGERCLIEQRFDRRLHSSGTYWLRLPSEDCCQATTTPIMATGDFLFLGFPASPTSRRAGSLRRRLRCRLNRSSYRLVSLLKWRQDARVIQAFRRDRLVWRPSPGAAPRAVARHPPRWRIRRCCI
jgi:hypothetical protein